MNDPARLRRVGDDAMRALLTHAERPRSMTPEERSSVGLRVARMAALPAGFGVLFWLKGLALGAGLGTAVIVTGVAVQKTREPAPVVSVSSKPSVPIVMSSAPAPSASAPEPAASVSSAAPVPVVPTKADQLAEEVAMIEEARGAAPARALELAAEHAKRFPSGQMAMEREIVAIEALKAMGRAGDARARAAAVLNRSRGTLYEERILNLVPELGTGDRRPATGDLK